jgi:hypothetical protein
MGWHDNRSGGYIFVGASIDEVAFDKTIIGAKINNSVGSLMGGVALYNGKWKVEASVDLVSPTNNGVGSVAPNNPRGFTSVGRVTLSAPAF